MLLSPVETEGIVRSAYRLPTERRGLIGIGPLPVVVADPFGLAGVAVRGRRHHRAHRAPPRSTTSSPRRWPAATSRSPVSASAPLAASAGDDFAALREYVVGDDLRRVHWPSSARHGDLLVRQDEVHWQGRTTVVLDTRGHTHTDDTFEAAVSAAASVIAASWKRRDLVRLVTTAGWDSGIDAGQRPRRAPARRAGPGAHLPAGHAARRPRRRWAARAPVPWSWSPAACPTPSAAASPAPSPSGATPSPSWPPPAGSRRPAAGRGGDVVALDAAEASPRPGTASWSAGAAATPEHGRGAAATPAAVGAVRAGRRGRPVRASPSPPSAGMWRLFDDGSLLRRRSPSRPSPPTCWPRCLRRRGVAPARSAGVCHGRRRPRPHLGATCGRARPARHPDARDARRRRRRAASRAWRTFGDVRAPAPVLDRLPARLGGGAVGRRLAGRPRRLPPVDAVRGAHPVGTLFIFASLFSADRARPLAAALWLAAALAFVLLHRAARSAAQPVVARQRRPRGHPGARPGRRGPGRRRRRSSAGRRRPPPARRRGRPRGRGRARSPATARARPSARSSRSSRRLIEQSQIELFTVVRRPSDGLLAPHRPRHLRRRHLVVARLLRRRRRRPRRRPATAGVPSEPVTQTLRHPRASQAIWLPAAFEAAELERRGRRGPLGRRESSTLIVGRRRSTLRRPRLRGRLRRRRPPTRRPRRPPPATVPDDVADAQPRAARRLPRPGHRAGPGRSSRPAPSTPYEQALALQDSFRDGLVHLLARRAGRALRLGDRGLPLRHPRPGTASSSPAPTRRWPGPSACRPGSRSASRPGDPDPQHARAAHRAGRARPRLARGLHRPGSAGSAFEPTPGPGRAGRRGLHRRRPSRRTPPARRPSRRPCADPEARPPSRASRRRAGPDADRPPPASSRASAPARAATAASTPAPAPTRTRAPTSGPRRPRSRRAGWWPSVVVAAGVAVAGVRALPTTTPPAAGHDRRGAGRPSSATRSPSASAAPRPRPAPLGDRRASSAAACAGEPRRAPGAAASATLLTRGRLRPRRRSPPSEAAEAQALGDAVRRRSSWPAPRGGAGPWPPSTPGHPAPGPRPRPRAQRAPTDRPADQHPARPVER